jgi:hypothetical protein
MVQMLLEALSKIQHLHGQVSLVHQAPCLPKKPMWGQKVNVKMNQCSCYLCLKDIANILEGDFFTGYEGPWLVCKMTCKEDNDQELDNEILQMGHNREGDI